MNATSSSSPWSPSRCSGWRRCGHWLRQPRTQDLIAAALAGALLGSALPLRYHWGAVEVYARVAGVRSDETFSIAAARKRDVRIGQVVQLPEFRTPTGSIRLPRPTGLTGLAFATNCRSCASGRRVMALERMARRYPNLKPYLVVFARDSLPEVWQDNALRVAAVMDYNAEAAKRLNVTFEFQFLLLDARGRLLYASAKGQELEDVERELASVLGTAEGGRGSWKH